MALLVWNENMSVGVAGLDVHHKRLILLVRDLNDAMLAGKGKDVLGNIFSDLINYTKTHFAAEEKYFDQFGYPASDFHKQEHRRLVQKVTDFQKQFEDGKIGLSLQVMDFLSDWLLNHIQKEDKKYGSFFNEKGFF